MRKKEGKRKIFFPAKALKFKGDHNKQQIMIARQAFSAFS